MVNEPLNKDEIIEKLAELEHQQWGSWSKNLWLELCSMRRTLDETKEGHSVIGQIDARCEKWERNWKPYAELDEQTKEFDREWARKAYAVFEELMKK